MKKILTIVVVIGVTASAILFGALSFLTYEVTKEPDACAPSSLNVSPAGDTDSGELTIKGMKATPEQMQNAAAITTVAVENELPARAAEIAIMTAIQESTLVNLPYGYPGSTSIGLFQQIKAWGPRKVRMDPFQSSLMFYRGGRAGQRGLVDIPNWQSLDRGDAAQAVQGSAFPDAYEVHEAEAIAIVAEMLGDETVAQATQECEDVADPIEEFVAAALGRVGDKYVTGALMTSDSADDAGFSLPSSLESLSEFEGSEDRGVTGKFISRSDITSGTEQLEPGDIVLTSAPDGEPGVAEDAGVYMGTGSTGVIKIATLNVLGASHTPDSGPESWRNRIKKQTRLIKDNGFTVIGLQELEPVQRSELLKLLGDGWGIHPEKPTFGNSPEIDARNSIVWDKSQVEAVELSDLDMSRYFDGNRKQIPLVKFQDTEGQEFWVANTHDPAKPIYASQRLVNAQQHAADMDQLSSQGLPMFFVGDFNSGFAVRQGGNTTVGDDRENLTWCVMTKSGTMANAYDVSRTPPRYGPCPKETSVENGIGPVDHIYVSRDVKVGKYGKIEGRANTASDHPVIYIETAAQDSTLLGEYVGVDDEGVVDTLRLRPSGFIGVIRLTVSSPGLVADDWMFPLAVGTYNYSSPYGPRQLGSDDFHNGADFGTQGVEAPLVAMHAGTVIGASYKGAWGNYLMVETGIPVPDEPGSTYKYMYAHMSRYELGYTLGSELTVGQAVGNVGNTGNSFGQHLHLNICTNMDCLNGDAEGTIDPIPFLAALGIKP